MQQEVLAFLRSRKPAGLPDTDIIDRLVEGEFPLFKRGQVVSFVDAIEILEIRLKRFVSAFEIKPVIVSPTAVIRQVKSQLALIRSNLKPTRCDIHIVVPATDPLLPELRAEWPQTWAWGFKLDQEVDD
jgi:hypothetical protein